MAKSDTHYLFFLDDTYQSKPTIQGMGKMFGIGGFCIPISEVQAAIEEVDAICGRHGFPNLQEEFKWSPSRKHWMRDNLVEGKREAFFSEILHSISSHEITCFVVLEDTTCGTATGCKEHREDAFNLLIEKYEMFLQRNASTGMIIVDRSGGDIKDDETFLQACFATLKTGTQYIKPKNIVCNVVTTSSHLNRLLQIADLIIGITCVRTCYARNPLACRLFEVFKTRFDEYSGSRGNIGLKIQPSIYSNLYHWVLGDTHFRVKSSGYPMPLKDYKYSENPYVAT